MKNMLCIVFSLAYLGTFTQACSSQPSSEPDTRAADEAAIREADVAWSKTGETRNIDAMMSIYTEDAVLLAQNVPLVTGKPAIREALTAFYATPGLSASWRPVQVEVARSGEIGYSRGIVEIRRVDPNGKLSIQNGKYVEVWRKQPDGTWKVAVDMFNFDELAATDSIPPRPRSTP